MNIKNILNRSIIIVYFTLIFTLLSNLFLKVANAQVVINEFSSWESSGDWIELYAYENADISGWILRDYASSVVETIPQGTLIGPSSGAFYVVEAGNRLNKDGDVIKLLKADDTTLVDQLTYGNQGGVCAPGHTQSAGRYPDANATVEKFKSVTKPLTKGTSNNSGELDPCPTPTSDPTDTPTSTPKPTSTSTPKPTSTLAPTNSPTRKPTLQVEPSPNEEENEEQTLGIVDVKNITPSPFAEKGDTETKKKFPILAGALMLVGGGFIFASLYPFLKRAKKGI